MKFKTRLFVILWVAGLLGVLSFLLVDLGALIAQIPLPAGTEIPLFTPAMKALSLIQPAALLSAAVLVGVALAPRVGLAAPLAEALARRGDIRAALMPQVIPALVAGLLGSAGIILSWLLWKPFLPPEFVVRSIEINRLLPLPTRLLYGGLTEELLLRWGLMTFLVWAAWRFFQRKQGEPKSLYFVGAIIISAVMFALGHLPFVFVLIPNANVSLVLYVLVANSLFGLIAGYVYWKKGLESAIMAHMLVHLVLVGAIFFEV